MRLTCVLKPARNFVLAFLISAFIGLFIVGLQSRLNGIVSRTACMHMVNGAMSADCHQSPVLKRIETPFPAISVEAKGDILHRIRILNVALEQIRNHELTASTDSSYLKTVDDWRRVKSRKYDLTNCSYFEKLANWTIAPPGEMTTLYEWNDDFLLALSDYPQVKTVILPWMGDRLNWNSLNDTSNLFIREYYVSTASEPLCQWIETPGKVNYAFDMINNYTCNRDINHTTRPRSPPLLALNVKAPYKDYYTVASFPPSFHQETPFAAYRLHVIRYGIINRVGDVFSGNLKIVPYGCFPIMNLDLPTKIEEIPLHKEVFIIAQHHGDEMFHRLSEVMPRIAVCVDFLLRNPSIKIFCLENSGLLVEFLQVLGITKDRIVTGWNRAEVVYLPRSTNCCLQNFLETQILSLHFRNFLKRPLASGPLKRDRLIVIRRSHYRRFKDQGGIEEVVRSAASHFNLSFSVFADKPAPSVHDTMFMFNSAVLVVGPHGAGLANVVFSEPGTYVIEGVCNLPHANLFFQRTALVLGHRWHGIPAVGGCTHGVFGVVDLPPSTLKSVLYEYLNIIVGLSDRNLRLIH